MIEEPTAGTDFKVDYHVHSDFSQDAEGSVADYCRTARDMGIDEICFTPHFEIDPVRAELDDRVRLNGRFVPMFSDWVDHYFRDVEQARRDHAPLRVLVGLEVGYDPAIEGQLRAFISRYQFDYVLGSVHCIDHIAITAHDKDDFYYARTTAEQATRGYFDMLNRLIESALFDAIGHIDVFKKYGVEQFGSRLVELAEPLWPDVFRRIVAHAPLTIELNTSGLRQAPAETYPGERVLRIARSAGLEYVTIGADGHRLQHLGYGLDEGRRLARELGFRIARFEQRRLLPGA